MKIYYIYDTQLQSFINGIKLEIKYKNIVINLMDYLPYFKQGYILSIGDRHILCQLYIILNNVSILTNNIIIKNFIGDSIEDFVFNNLNSFDVLNSKDVDIYKQEKLITESNILQSLNIILKHDIYSLLKICLPESGRSLIWGVDNLINILTKNNDIKLIYNIIRGNKNIVKSLLINKKLCPLVGYSVSRLKNDNINDYIKLICIERIWHIKQALSDINTDVISIISDYLNEFMK